MQGVRSSAHAGLAPGCLHLHVNLKRQVLKQIPLEPSPHFALPPKHLTSDVCTKAEGAGMPEIGQSHTNCMH
jgi:hypothetical protein